MDEQQNKEKQIYQMWQDQGLFTADPTSSKPPFSLLMPPPNVTGDLHLGHAMQHSILDAIARYKRLSGFDVLLLPGVDHAGIQFESTLNKMLSKDGINPKAIDRQDWLKRAWEYKDQVYQKFHDTWTIFGLSADWSREVFTLDETRQAAVVEEFQRYWNDGLIYKGAYIVQWCPKDQTAIEEVEMEYQEKKDKLYYVDYQVEGTDETITVATVRPETIYADVALAIYPNHPKYIKFAGQNVINPLTKQLIPVITDQRVQSDFGTGALKITPGHDPLDYAIGKDHALPILHAISKDGKMTELAQDLAGLKIADAKLQVEELLQQSGNLKKVEEYTHSVPVCERCKTTIEPLVSEEWFVKAAPLAEKGLAKIAQNQIDFLPQNYQKMTTDWLEGIHDWCISRSLWWGHRIPAWYCLGCNPNKQVHKGSGFMISLTKPEGGCVADPDQSAEVTKACQNCSGCDWVQDDQVLDTWFSSGLWPLSTLGWPEKTEMKDRYFPWSFEISGPEIRYLWISRMIMISSYLENQVPFRSMFFHGTMRDLKGQKMSKSLGNGIDPIEVRNQWGTDAVRMALYSYSAPGRDGKASRQTFDERGKNYRNFGTKIRNIARFIYDLKPEDAHMETDWSHERDQEIIQYFNGTIANTTRHLDTYNLHLAIDELYDFIWNKFASSYLEENKSRRAEAQPVLEKIFKESLILLHPFMPFTTEELWQQYIDQSSIMTAQWPRVGSRS